ncbi:cytochrome-c peroxidase [Paucibacter sp. B2R-40]|uniref:cytochrome-c peroxidase n=1 Tax=Paucibacter sp. B2R-40 TaxID=2893554 RepID=UPI0021E490C4|nr:cytochrome c peroxidase [Paucibacter sp. B2R-40]MCV2352875.1 cytochrome-c peroxidase [Paucibacter sp. B2R-40]
MSAKAQLGEKIFLDRSLSGSGRLSCASCHDPAFAHGPPNALAVQIGGSQSNQAGLRAAPSLRYLERLGGFNGTPATKAEDLRGGLMADGRVDSLAAQAFLPWFNPREMDNGSVAELARRLRGAAYANQFLTAFATPAADDSTLVTQASEALQALQVEDTRFHPYDSKADFVLAGKAQLSLPEGRGLTVFSDKQGANCASCHSPDPSSSGQPPLFTNFGYAALAVPRNTKLSANQDPIFRDLGLCGPSRTDLARRTELCGFFRTPGLRNVAERKVFFHNGVMSSLAQVLDFYNTRDREPARWYSSADGQTVLYDDLPQSLHGNVNQLAPFGAQARRLTAQELADLECFLRTLSDGYVPGTPSFGGCN